MNFIRENIRFLRARSGLSQADFGELFGLTRAQVASYEEKTEPRIDTLVQIADYFNVDLKALATQRLDEGRMGAPRKPPDQPAPSVDRIETLEAVVKEQGRMFYRQITEEQQERLRQGVELKHLSERLHAIEKTLQAKTVA